MANEVAFEYGAWGAVTKSMQDHAAAATSTDPNVQYAYEDGIASNEAKYVRPCATFLSGTDQGSLLQGLLRRQGRSF